MRVVLFSECVKNGKSHGCNQTFVRKNNVSVLVSDTSHEQVLSPKIISWAAVGKLPDAFVALLFQRDKFFSSSTVSESTALQHFRPTNENLDLRGTCTLHLRLKNDKWGLSEGRPNM